MNNKYCLLVVWKMYFRVCYWSLGINDILIEDLVIYNLIKDVIYCLFINKCMLCLSFIINIFRILKIFWWVYIIVV